LTGSRSVCLLGLGEVGSILADDLLHHGDVQIVVWDLLLASPQTAPAGKLRSLMASGRVSGARTAELAARGCQVII
jgi:saccharopine dehydrogenase-like NADP-dependent oxidoreductase